MTVHTSKVAADLRWKPNVTVAAIIEREGRFLLVEEQTEQGLRLNNPAGHMDPGESPVQACIRETMEETTHAFTPTDLVGIYLTQSGSCPSGGITYLRFAFCGTLGTVDPFRQLDSGIVRTLWLTLAELEASAHRHRSSMVLRGVHDYLAGKRFPLDMIYANLGAAAST